MRSNRTAPRSRRKRRRTNWHAVLWLVVCLNVVLGLAFSPSTSARKVRVAGALPGDQERLSRHLQTLRRVPAMRVNTHQVLSLVLANDEIESATFRQNVFGRALLEIRPRVAVARLKGERPIALSDRGRLYLASSIPEGLPVVALPADAQAIGATLMGSWDLKRVAYACEQSAKVLPKSGWTVELSSRGVISLRRDPRCRVILGTTDGLSAKFEQLKKILDGQPSLLEQVRELNLTAAENPVVVPLSESPAP